MATRPSTPSRNRRRTAVLPSAAAAAASATALATFVAWGVFAAPDPAIPRVQRTPAGDLEIEIQRPAGTFFAIESAGDGAGLGGWVTLATRESPPSGTTSFTDAAAAYLPQQFYRAVPLEEPPALTGDHLATGAGDVVIHPVYHATVALGWGDTTIYIDPDTLPSGNGGYDGLPEADLVLVTHTHGDHFDQGAINSLRHEETVIVAPQAVYGSMSGTLRALTTVLANGETAELLGLTVEATPAYNANHPRGAGNSYVVTIGGRRLFFTGDTGNIPEIRALDDVDVAFVCMNLPFTMSGPQAAAMVREFTPHVVYPYHYRNQGGSLTDLDAFKESVGTDRGVEVRLRDWY